MGMQKIVGFRGWNVWECKRSLVSVDGTYGNT